MKLLKNRVISPVLLVVDSYESFGLSEKEALVIIHLLRAEEDKSQIADLETLFFKMNCSLEELSNVVDELVEKNIIQLKTAEDDQIVMALDDFLKKCYDKYEANMNNRDFFQKINTKLHQNLTRLEVGTIRNLLNSQNQENAKKIKAQIINQIKKNQKIDFEKLEKMIIKKVDAPDDFESEVKISETAEFDWLESDL